MICCESVLLVLALALALVIDISQRNAFPSLEHAAIFLSPRDARSNIMEGDCWLDVIVAVLSVRAHSPDEEFLTLTVPSLLQEKA